MHTYICLLINIYNTDKSACKYIHKYFNKHLFIYAKNDKQCCRFM